ncbi:MAG: ATP-binding protein [Methanobrevibacter sp.]|jgi:hypothetical protein|nr:ATP-binding protein [Candidatus Methanovirga australis]
MEKEDIMNKLSLGLSEFDDIIKQDKIYVDKTKFIKKMLDQGRKYYFLSRPRRFGKTLFVSTLENFFQCNKNLFKNTYIHDNWKEWIEYPVLRIYMNDLLNSSSLNLEKDILGLINDIAKKNNVELSEEKSYMLKFKNLIEELSKLSKTNEIVVLIDEYDAPIINNINNNKLADENREILQNFYNVLKNSEKFIKFVFITGISKFTKTSIFSKFNNLTELTLDEDYSTICGITHEELKKYYHNHIQILADKNNYSFDEAIERINYFYDGYSWDGIKNVFNPNSTLKALSQKKFSSFWFSTGTPSFIAEIFKNKKITENYFKPTILKETDLDAIDPDNINETTLLFQAGYLTIEEEFIENDEIYYSLKIPNFEVKQAYKNNLLDLYIDEVEEDIINSHKQLWEDIKNGDCESLADYLEIQFGEIPYYLNLTNKRDRWKLKQTIFLKLLEYMGFKTKGEVAISQGRIDATFRDKEHVVVCEVKYTQNQRKPLNELVDEALNQIHEKQYYRLYEKKKFLVILLALAFKDVKINEKNTLTKVKCKIEKINPK